MNRVSVADLRERHAVAEARRAALLAPNWATYLLWLDTGLGIHLR